MKAVIMAGGEGTRLRPVSDQCVKPMVRLLGRPLLEHILLLLRSYDIRDVCITLRRDPQQISGYFGSGENLGMNLSYHVETEPLGTAGGVKACADFTGVEDFLVVSGDAACDFDLRRLIEEHTEHSPAVTMALYAHQEPLAYGLAVSNRQGRVVGFVEKPQWPRVVTDRVNTGIYVISPQAMQLVPDGREFDFAKDLFPMLLEKELPIQGAQMDGYWCDVGTPQAYLKCTVDALSGILTVTPGRRAVLSGDVTVISPSFIEAGAVLDSGCRIGPHACVAAGSYIGRGAVVENSVINGGVVAAGSAVCGAVVCKNGVAAEAITQPGSIIAPPWAQRPPEAGQAPGHTSRRPMRASSLIDCRDRAQLMRILSESFCELGADYSDGLTISGTEGSIRVSPVPCQDALLIEAHANSQHEAQALVSEMCELARAFDLG